VAELTRVPNRNGSKACSPGPDWGPFKKRGCTRVYVRREVNIRVEKEKVEPLLRTPAGGESPRAKGFN